MVSVSSSEGSNDTLYSIVFSRLCESHEARFEALRLAPPQLFAAFSKVLAERTDERKPSIDVLRQSISEFNSLVGLYCCYIVCPLYDKVPLKLTPEVLNVYNGQGLEKALIQFRERYDGFLGSYMDFLKRLDRKLPCPLEPVPFGYYFERPKPITPSSRKDGLHRDTNN